MNRGASLVLAAVLGGVVVGGVVWLAKPDAPAAAATAAPARPSASAPQTARATLPPSTPVQSQPPPWAASGAVTPAPTGLAAAIRPKAIDPQRAQARAALRARLQRLTANGRHATLAEASSVLGELEKLDGSHLSGINIAAVRKNLEQVGELQRVARELQAESQRPGGGDKQKIQDLLARLKEIEAGMQFNLTAAAPAPVTQK
ncbi:MAG TPA: hypothetical protein VFG73_10990 [Rhodanobacteraceae bacterium]|nr:hypothetical protein [Rhodanobacteraceae bacterium]